jgi:hypothetical protein
MKKACIYCIVLATMCGGLIRCSAKKLTITEPATESTLTAPPNPYPLKTNITGVVKNETGETLANAQVRLNNGQTVQINALGQFTIETILPDAGATASLFISHPGLVTSVRSYHANMQQAQYDITMHPPVECCIKNDCFISPASNVVYRNYRTDIDEELAGILAPLVDSLREHPFCSLRFTAYGKGVKPGNRADERLRQIGEYFAGKGISENRIITLKRETKLLEVIDVEVVRIKD